MQPSPYTPGQVATILPGRDAQIEAMRERLGYVSQFQRLAGRIRVDVGPRGVGKTSLLRLMQADAEAAGFQSVWITAGDGPLLAALTDEFQRLATNWIDRAGETVRAALKTLRVSIAGISLSTGADDGAGATRRTSAGRALQDVIVPVGREVAKQHAGLALFIDEIQSADSDGLRALGYAWQHLQSEAADLPAVAFTAGLSHSQDVITQAVSFGERFDYNHLGGLDETAARSALTAPASDRGVQWDDDALDAALGKGQGYPYFIQLIGEQMWQAAGYPDPGGALTVEHFQRAARQFDTSQHDFFRARWMKASGREAELLTAVASLGDGPQRRMDVARVLGVPTSAISMARSSLMDKGLIETVKHGYLSFTAPGFAAFIREQTGLNPGADSA